MKKQIKNNNNLWLKCGGNIHRHSFGDWLKKDFSSGTNANVSNNISSIVGGATGVISGFTNNAPKIDTSNIDNTINTFTYTPIESSSREALSNQWINTRGLKSDYTGDDFRTSDLQRVGNTFSSTLSGAVTGAKYGGFWGGIIGGVAGLASGVGGIIKNNIDANSEARRLNREARLANINRIRNNNYMADYLDEQDALGFLRGDYALGGYLGQSHGANWSNNVTHINEGNTHEMNPYDGVQVGVDQEGNPDLVEEGEVIFNDYVFSNRLSPTKEQLTEALLPEKYADHTFAWIANELSKESEERANDAISINGLNDSMNKLIQLHELVRQENELQESNKFAEGGNKGEEEKVRIKLERERRKNERKAKQLEKVRKIEEQARLIREEAERKRQADDMMRTLGFDDYDSMDQESKLMYDAIQSGAIQYNNGSTSNPIVINQVLSNGNYDTSYINELISRQSRTRDTGEFHGPFLKSNQGNNSGSGNNSTKKSNPKNIEEATPDIYQLYENLKNEALGLKINTPDNLIDKAVTNQKDTDIQHIEDNIRRRNMDNHLNARVNNIENDDLGYSTLLRYAPILGNALAYLGNRKDYSDVNSFMEQTVNPRSVDFTPLGNYIRPEYISEWEMINPIERQTSATRSALMNNAGNNRAAASAALVGSDYNTLGLLGQAMLQGKQFNNAQKLQAAEFNKNIDQYNSQGSLQAQTTNMSLNEYGLQRALQEYNMRNNIDMAYNQARSANITSLFNNLGNIGRENFIMNQLNSDSSLRQLLERNGWSTYKG